jgi:histidinol-phosphate aminotransferase
VNDVAYGPSPDVIATIGHWATAINRSPDAYSTRLTAALSRLHNLPAHCFAVGAGSSQLIHDLIRCSIASGVEAIALDPSYTEYRRSAISAGARVRTIRLNREETFRISPDQVCQNLSVDTKLIIICNPNNPTGTVLDPNDIRHLLSAVGNDVVVLVDEAYIEFTPHMSAIQLTDEFPNLVVVRTFSKAYAMAGLRVGYAAFGNDVSKKYSTMVRPPWPLSTLAENAAICALASSTYLDLMVGKLLSDRDRLMQALLARAPVDVLPTSTHYFMLDLARSKLGATELCERLRERNVFIRHCGSFSERLGDRYVRITTQTDLLNHRIVDEIERVLS